VTGKKIKKERQTWQAHFYRFSFKHSRNCKSKRFEAKKTKQNTTKAVLHMNNLFTETITTYCLIPVNSSNSYYTDWQKSSANDLDYDIFNSY